MTHAFAALQSATQPQAVDIEVAADAINGQVDLPYDECLAAAQACAHAWGLKCK